MNARWLTGWAVVFLVGYAWPVLDTSFSPRADGPRSAVQVR